MRKRRKPDDGLRALLRRHLGHIGQWTTIETGGTESGVPDANVCCPGGIETWIECKATRAWAVNIEPEQVGWIDRRVRLGGRVLIAVRRHCEAGPRREERDELWILHGAAARPLRLTRSLQGVPAQHVLARWQGGPSRWQWPALAHMLTHRL